jgi:tetratricopeptide (TPR) repeat protein
MVQTTLRDYLQNTEDAISSGRIEDAMVNCQHVLSYFPEALEAQRLLGEIYLAQGHLEEAQHTFDWILANDPENVIAYCDRALICERQDDIDTALDCYQQAYELSRGNSQIRQEFNQLSAKAGQQEFMFSRAGLARLYMRGDLLTQAIQEWEAVLGASPERLDARIGLLEAYWREGIYDQVEQLATRILEEAPTCLKALVLLAHVTSASNMQRAEELIQRAEAFDPELVMAQELFSDLIASQPNDPFLNLIKKEPIFISDASADEKQAFKGQTAINAPVEINGSHSSADSSNHTPDWNNLESWRELDAIRAPQAEHQPLEEAAITNSWPDKTTIQNTNSWTTTDQINHDHSKPELEAWQGSQEIDDDFDPALLEQQPWFQADQPATPTPGSENVSSYLNNIGSIDSWTSEGQPADVPTPPAWLDMLTKGDRQLSGSIPAQSIQPPILEEPITPVFSAQPQVESISSPQKSYEKDFSIHSSPSQKEEEASFFFATEDDDLDREWPEWLKSLGAETIESEPESEVAPTVSETQQPVPFQSWTDQIDQTLSEADKQKLATLEYLENDLRAQGFVPLQPGTLSTIAQEPTLSSALAQLGNFVTQSPFPEQLEMPGQATQLTTPMRPAAPATTEQTYSSPVTPFAELQQAGPEPLWVDTPGQIFEMSTSLIAEQPTVPDSTSTNMPAESSFPGTDSEAPVPNRIFEQTTNATTNATQEAPFTPAYRVDALLENELETTMKRPAIRLQPMQYPGSHPDTSYIINRGHSGEREASSKIQDENLSNKERLLKGYQFQLVGAYDDSMQEYRIIIRNAPELLGEVISNVRALLKLVPRYSVGYRVLGDAYMRQGEYLQAMEAYNKALTMAKKAKSQSR